MKFFFALLHIRVYGFFLCGFLDIFSEAALVTFEYGGRLGDSLLSYAHAEWFAYKRGCRVLLNPFFLDDQLNLAYNVVKWEKFPRNKSLKGMQKITSLGDQFFKPVCYIPYFSDFFCERKFQVPIFDVDWCDEVFLSRIRKNISAARPISLILPKKQGISIAAHVRTTGRFDPKDTENIFPEKFPPLIFYKKCLALVCEKFNTNSAHLQLFTDALDPIKILESLKLSSKTFLHHEHHLDSSVLQDFFSLSHYPIIIRGESNFSFMAARVGYPLLEIFPKKIERKKDKLFFLVGLHFFLDRIENSYDEQLYKALFQTCFNLKEEDEEGFWEFEPIFLKTTEHSKI